MSYKIESTIIVNGSNFAFAVAAGARLSSVRSKSSGEIGEELGNLAQRYSDAIETGIAKATGSRIISEKTGRGLQVDLIRVNVEGQTEVSEVKGSLIESIFREIQGEQGLSLFRASGIKLGTDIRIGKSGADKLVTGYSVNDSGQFVEEADEITEEEKFIRAYKGNPARLKAHLKNPASQRSEAIRKIIFAIRANLFLKSLTLQIPFSINNKQTGVTTLKFDPDYILENAKVKFNAETGNIEIGFVYPKTIIQEALNNVSKSPKVKQAIKNYNTNFVRIVNQDIRSIPNNATKLQQYSNIIDSIEKSLDKKSFAADVIHVPGSIAAYLARLQIKEKKAKDKKSVPTMPSIIDITALVQGRARLKMRRGSGEPKPPKIYERSGTFRASIQAYVRFKQRRVDYFYLPYYDSLEQYGYQIEDLVEGSIRSITQQYFNQEFQLVKSTI